MLYNMSTGKKYMANSVRRMNTNCCAFVLTTFYFDYRAQTIFLFCNTLYFRYIVRKFLNKILYFYSILPILVFLFVDSISYFILET